jgi:hypothetical protein
MKKNYKLVICAFLSFCAALGTLPYGYRFAEIFGLKNKLFLITFGLTFALTAGLANMMLGTYSLTNKKPGEKMVPSILLLSTLGSMPYGFLCYFGYQSLLPFVLNVTISVIVVIVNAGIGYTAIRNLLLSIKPLFTSQKEKLKLFSGQAIVRMLGFLIGLSVSIVTYLAASSGITDLLISFNQTWLVQQHFGFIIAIIPWLPAAALFANANQVVAADLYHSVSDFQNIGKNLNLNTVLLILFCLASGTAIAEMTFESFDLAKHIPAFFKTDLIQIIAHSYLVPIALFSSAALNYFSISQLFKPAKVKAANSPLTAVVAK